MCPRSSFGSDSETAGGNRHRGRLVPRYRTLPKDLRLRQEVDVVHIDLRVPVPTVRPCQYVGGYMVVSDESGTGQRLLDGLWNLSDGGRRMSTSLWFFWSPGSRVP